MEHKCKKMEECHKASRENHNHIGGYGCAISNIEYSDDAKRWYAHNNEYTSIVNYCPFCGLGLKEE